MLCFCLNTYLGASRKIKVQKLSLGIFSPFFKLILLDQAILFLDSILFLSCFVGEGCSSFNITNQLPGAYPRATYLLKFALKKLDQGDLIEPDEILPIYLNDESSSLRYTFRYTAP